MRSWAAVLVLLMGSVAFAGDPPTVTLNAQAEYPRDKQVAIELEGLQDVSFRAKWEIWSTRDTNPDPDFRVYQDGTGVSVWGSPGAYRALVVVGVPDCGAEQGGTVHWIDLDVRFVILGEAGPVDPNDPVGPVDPNDPLAYYELRDLTIELCRPIRDDAKAEGCQIMADAFKEHGKLAVAGEYATTDELSDACSSQYVFELGMMRYLRYRPAMTRLREAMQKLINEGRVESDNMEQWGQIWLAIGEGFQHVADNATQERPVQDS